MLSKNTCRLLSGVALLALGMPALAQTTDEDASWRQDTIVVTGHRTGYSAASTASATRTDTPLIDQLSTYTFNTGKAQHTFCSVCGVKSFYTPRSNPDGRAVTWRCLDDPYEFTSVEIHTFDGVNWEKNAASLAHKSKG